MADTTQTIMEGGSPGMTRRNSVGGGAHGMHRRTSSHRIVKAAALAAHHEMNTIGTVQLSKVDAAIRAADAAEEAIEHGVNFRCRNN